jgi:PEP-CTERM motif
MNTALKCALVAAVGIVSFALPTLASIGCDPATRCVTTVPEPATIMLLAGGLATVIGVSKFRKN